MYANAVRRSIPQTALYGIILDHFTQAKGKTPKCLIIGFDGARADALAHILPVESGIQALLEGGGKACRMYAGGNRGSRQLTDTAPGWAAMLTGAWAKGPGGNGVTSNDLRKPAGTPNLVMTELLERGTAKKSTFIVSWKGHFANDAATYHYDILHAREKNLNAEWITREGDARVIRHTLDEIRAVHGADIVMAILEHCDSAGHGSGYGNRNPKYVEAFRASDRAALDMIRAVEARPGYDSEDWLILITSDHGGIGTSHGSRRAACRRVFFVANKDVDM